jgi:uncharacterized membrane protein YdjX (TVP38/TMEM64 family)
MRKHRFILSVRFLISLFVISLGAVSSLKSPLQQVQLPLYKKAVSRSSRLSLPSGDTEYELLELNGGGSEQIDTSDKKKKLQVGIAIMIPTCYLLWAFRDKWLGLFNKEKLQSKTLDILHGLNDMPKYYSYSLYMIGMAFWETLGLSTIPVETAAGMVFGWTGFILSASGKLAGAIIAFGLGRYGMFANWIQNKLSSNSFLQLVRDSTDSNPLLVSFLLKCSCFPETVKNYGSAILNPIKLWMFIFTAAVHGWTFSALWTYLGVDAAARLENSSLPADRRLELLLAAALVNGVVVSPLAMAYWVKSLKEHQKNSKK